MHIAEEKSGQRFQFPEFPTLPTGKEMVTETAHLCLICHTLGTFEFGRSSAAIWP